MQTDREANVIIKKRLELEKCQENRGLVKSVKNYQRDWEGHHEEKSHSENHKYWNLTKKKAFYIAEINSGTQPEIAKKNYQLKAKWKNGDGKMSEGFLVFIQSLLVWFFFC